MYFKRRVIRPGKCLLCSERERERDEALAQVALLIELCQRVRCAEDPEEYLRELEAMLEGDRIDKARALLDRLELAERKLEDGQFCKEGLWYCRDAKEMAMCLHQVEAVVEAISLCTGSHGAFSCHEPHDCRCPKSRADSPEKWKGEWKCECGREQLDQALAEWEEAKG